MSVRSLPALAGVLSLFFLCPSVVRADEDNNHTAAFLRAGVGARYLALGGAGVAIADDAVRTPVHNEETFETNRPGLYLAGTVCGGLHTSRWFIENGRFHAGQIMKHIAHGTVEPLELEERYWKTAE